MQVAFVVDKIYLPARRVYVNLTMNMKTNTTKPVVNFKYDLKMDASNFVRSARKQLAGT